MTEKEGKTLGYFLAFVVITAIVIWQKQTSSPSPPAPVSIAAKPHLPEPERYAFDQATVQKAFEAAVDIYGDITWEHTKTDGYLNSYSPGLVISVAPDKATVLASTGSDKDYSQALSAIQQCSGIGYIITSVDNERNAIFDTVLAASVEFFEKSVKMRGMIFVVKPLSLGRLGGFFSCEIRPHLE
jgi:hypothetical protein